MNVSNVALGLQAQRQNWWHEVIGPQGAIGVESGGKGRRKQRPMSRNLELWGSLSIDPYDHNILDQTSCGLRSFLVKVSVTVAVSVSTGGARIHFTTIRAEI